jgi:hypothetical protein
MPMIANMKDYSYHIDPAEIHASKKGRHSAFDLLVLASAATAIVAMLITLYFTR